jgi:hypothetical protein
VWESHNLRLEQHHTIFLNHTFYYPGKTTWQPITAVIVDTIDPTANATQEIMKVLEESGYDLPTTPTITAGFGTVSKDKAVNAALGQVKSQLSIQMETVLKNGSSTMLFLREQSLAIYLMSHEDYLNVTTNTFNMIMLMLTSLTVQEQFHAHLLNKL